MGSSSRLLDPANKRFDGQDRVNAEIFTAMEIIGRKLERVEGERDRLAHRLSLIELSAKVDQKTGKLYLPAIAAPQKISAPLWMKASNILSTGVALAALGFVLMRAPVSALTPEQTSMLEEWRRAQVVAAAAPSPAPATVASVDEGKWKTPEEVEPDITAATVEMPKEEIAPVAPAAAAPVVAEAAPAEVELAPDAALTGKAAELQTRAYQGLAEAQHDLAALYVSGQQKVTKNYDRAIYWFKKAAAADVANAHYNLGVIYQQGLGVPASMGTALSWYEKAAELGHPEAMYNLGIAYLQGLGTKQNVTRGISYFKRAAEAGVAQAAYNLGIIYESTAAGTADPEKALTWYKLAAKEGSSEAADAIARLKDLDEVEPASGEGDADLVEEMNVAPPKKSAETQANALMVKVQQALIEKGLLGGTADGESTPQTEDAIRGVQHKLGLLEDGLPSEDLLKKIEAAQNL